MGSLVGFDGLASLASSIISPTLLPQLELVGPTNTLLPLSAPDTTSAVSPKRMYCSLWLYIDIHRLIFNAIVPMVILVGSGLSNFRLNLTIHS